MYLERFKLDGRVAVVTGGAQAVGFACVEALAEAGAYVYTADRNPATGRRRKPLSTPRAFRSISSKWM
jgi:NAD(P)-dependent dehydrogenase (short-subunit alcohol dehydrogenase family)